MALNFSNSFEWTSQGALKNKLLPGSSIRFIQDNLDGTDNVSILIVRKTGRMGVLKCTLPLSKIIRTLLKTKSKNQVLKQLLDYDVKKHKENGKYFLFNVCIEEVLHIPEDLYEELAF